MDMSGHHRQPVLHPVAPTGHHLCNEARIGNVWGLGNQASSKHGWFIMVHPCSSE